MVKKKKDKTLSEKAVEAAEKLFDSACERILQKAKPTDEGLKYFERALKVYNTTIDSFGAGGTGGLAEDPQVEFEKKRKEKKVCQGCGNKFTTEELKLYPSKVPNKIADLLCNTCGIKRIKARK